MYPPKPPTKASSCGASSRSSTPVIRISCQRLLELHRLIASIAFFERPPAAPPHKRRRDDAQDLGPDRLWQRVGFEEAGFDQQPADAPRVFSGETTGGVVLRAGEQAAADQRIHEAVLGLRTAGEHELALLEPQLLVHPALMQVDPSGVSRAVQGPQHPRQL